MACQLSQGPDRNKGGAEVACPRPRHEHTGILKLRCRSYPRLFQGLGPKMVRMDMVPTMGGGGSQRGVLHQAWVEHNGHARYVFEPQIDTRRGYMKEIMKIRHKMLSTDKKMTWIYGVTVCRNTKCQ